MIDSHIHFWDVANELNSWVKKTSLPQSISPEDVDATGYVHIEAHAEHLSPLCELTWLRNTFATGNIRVIAFLDFTQPLQEFERRLLLLAAQPEIVGVRQVMASSRVSAYSPFQQTLPADLPRKLAMLAANNLIFDAQMYPDQYLPILDDIIASDVIMAMEHMALPIATSAENMQTWQTLLKLVSQQPNCTLKLSGFDIVNHNNDITRVLDILFDVMPMERLCWGSNYPVSNQNDYRCWQTRLSNYLGDPTIENTVFYQTANRLYFNGTL
nr:amidohydrolase family protein [Alteromonas ponticola]